MLERKATTQFATWLSGPSNKALLVTGARQVGKTFLVEAFAREHFEHVVKFDLLEDKAARTSFAGAANADDLFLRMTIQADSPIVAGKTLVMLDEVQECPELLTYIKYLVQRGDCRYALTGSLLGVKLHNIDSLPVGFVTRVEMFPLDFEEFCWANGLAKEAFQLARACLASEESMPDFVYERMLALFHRYLIVGGMPDAVATFLASGNVDDVRVVHKNIHVLYRDDITKHAPEALRLVIRDIYDLVPSELGSRNRRFRLSSIRDVRRFSQVTDHFLWLTQAGVALPVYNVGAPTAPLLVAEQRNLFKLFYLDVGMLMSCYPKNLAAGVLDGISEMNLGTVYESFVAQELRAHGFSLRYFTSKKIGELDFVEEREDGSVIAIEVKSGSRYLTHAALDNALAVREYTVDDAFVLAETNIRRTGRILYMPVFLAGLIQYER